MDTENTQPAGTRKRHWIVRVLRALAILALLLVVVYLVADQIAYRNYQAQLERFRAQFGKVTYEEFIPKSPPAEADAGRVYRYAVGLMAEVEVEVRHGDWSPYHALTEGAKAFERRNGGGDLLPADDEIDTLVRDKMAAMSEMFPVLEEARALDRGSILDDYEVGQLLKPLTEARHLANVIAAKALLEARAGNLAGACAWLESGLHLASTLNEDPTLLVQMIRVALVEIALDAAERVFESTDAPLPLSERYWTLLADVADAAHFANGLASEIGYSVSSSMPGPRLLASLTQAKLIDIFLEVIEVTQLPPSSERLARLAEIQGGINDLSFFYTVVKISAPNLIRSGQTYDRMAARCDLMRLAVALREYKASNGAYPDALEAIAPSFEGPLPLDPFSGEAYRYQVEGNGFLLYTSGHESVVAGGPRPPGGIGDASWTATR